MTYEKPLVKRFGSLRELTLGGGAQESGDATNLYHRS
ncbi:MAG TPA: lasso RiPP family leader peptide-containing protein [Gemmatimonadaceae bacterium]|nr:lasso RiPP family leader peptide-containing protein [Gemmatimonadaceae bacterium]